MERPANAELARGLEAPRQFLVAHGPALRVLDRMHLTRRDHSPRAWALVLIAWLPLFVGALLRVAVGERPAPILFDLSVHTRLLLVIPLLILAERLLEQRCRDAVFQLYRGNFAERAAVDRIIDRAERLRDSHLAEIVMLCIVIASGQAMLWGLLGPTGVLAGITDAGGFSFARLWYVTVAWPIAQFLFLRWIWHWRIWTTVVVSVSRLPLATIATHPDHAAGLGFLGGPLWGFAGFVLAIAVLLASAWGTQILDGRATVQTFVPSFFWFLVLAAVIASGPLLLYIGHLYRARVRDIAAYNAVALDYVRAFHRKWVETRPDDEHLLGTSDLQSLNDLCGAYQNLAQVRLVPFGPRQILSIWLAALLPMIPLVATTMPIDELIRTIGGALLGGTLL